MHKLAYEINGRPCPPAAYYNAACETTRHIAIEACAGSGKTWILVSRILRALHAGAAPQSILAITFTKKAAGEMQERLGQWLAAFAQADDATLAEELQARGIAAPSEEDIQTLRGLQSRLLHTPQSVQIRTFHSWFTSLLQSAPLSVFTALGLPYPFSLFENDEALIEQVWPFFYQAIGQDAALEADYASLIAEIGRDNLQSALIAGLAKRLEFSLAEQAGSLEQSLMPIEQAFPQLSAYADTSAALAAGSMLHTQLAEHAETLSLCKGATEKKQAELLADALEAGDFDACLGALFTGSGSPRKALEKHAAGLAAIAIVQELKNWQLHAQALHYQARLLRLLRQLIASYSQLKRERAWVDMVDVELAAKKLLTHPELAAWMQEKLDAQVRHLLIDEFQDTSPLQWQILKEWLENYSGAGGGQEMPRLFLVGDPKQSIYRFRNADPRVFRDAQAMVKNLSGTILSCDHTRRNAPAIIEGLNRIFTMSSLGYDNYRPHTTGSQTAGAIYAQLFERPEKAQAAEGEADAWRDSLSTPREAEETPAQAAECAGLTQWLAEQIGSGCAVQHFMVLARKRSRLLQLQRHLHEAGIPSVVGEKNLLPDQLEVQDIMALLDVLHSPAQNLALAQVLKSPIGGWSDAQLVELALAAKNHSGSWWQALSAAAELGTPSPWAACYQQLLRWQDWVRSLPVYDALFAIYHDGGLLARYSQAAPAAQRARILLNLQGLLAAALDFQSGRFSHCWAFVRALRSPKEQSNFPAPAFALSQAVQLLTVHGAKGLEAEHVILIDTLPQADRADSYGVLSDWPAGETAPLRFIFYRSGAHHPPQIVQLLEQEKVAQARDELNALYVAMTRARQRLVFSATALSKGDNPNAWWEILQRAHNSAEAEAAPLLPLHADTSAAPAQQAQSSSAETYCQILQLPSIESHTEVAQAAPVTSPENTAPDNSLSARRGQALHRLLEWGLQERPKGQAWQERLMREYTLDRQDCEELLAQALRLRSGEAAWVWDASRISWAGNEVDIAHQGQLLRLDRLVQEAGTGCWWVIDYKSALTPERQAELQAQMQGYISAVQVAQPEATAVRGAWIAGDGRWVEFSSEKSSLSNSVKGAIA